MKKGKIRFVGEGFIPPGEVSAAAHGPGGIYAAPTDVPGRFVGDAYMRPGEVRAAANTPGGMNPSPTAPF